MALALTLCVCLYPLAWLWRSNLSQVPPQAVLPLLLPTLLFGGLAFGLAALLTRSPHRAGLLGALTAGLAFSFGHALNLLEGARVAGVTIGYAKLLLAWAGLWLAGALLIRRLRRPVSLAGPLAAAGVLLAVNLVPIVTFEVRLARAQPEDQPAAAIDAALPDIYYIVLDAYARADELADKVNFDNRAFTAALRERGFYLPECALSNYDGTVLTLASTLNLGYLDLPDGPVTSDQLGEAAPPEDIHFNQAAATFRSLGYQFVTGRGYADFNDIVESDLYLNYALEQGARDDLARQRFAALYLDTTALRALTELYNANPERYSVLNRWLPLDRQAGPLRAEAEFWYRQNNYLFDRLAELPRHPGNLFVYAHINAPHGPYAFASDGSFRYSPGDAELSKAEEAELYAGTLPYLNRRVLALIDRLIADSDPAPIIILQGDHAIHQLSFRIDKHKILSAYYLPGELTTPPYPTLTPVNNFRLVLRNYFDPSVELLPDVVWPKRENDYAPQPAACGLD
jgi:hypothetical protein